MILAFGYSSIINICFFSSIFPVHAEFENTRREYRYTGYDGLDTERNIPTTEIIEEAAEGSAKQTSNTCPAHPKTCYHAHSFIGIWQTSSLCSLQQPKNGTTGCGG